MNVTITPTTWHGLSAWSLDTEVLRTIIVPECGAKMVSLFDKRHQLEWLVGPGERPFRKVPYGATFTDQDMSGWDEMFPTILACDYPGEGDRHGTALPDHGEVWSLPWAVEQADTGTLTLSVEGQAVPYRLTRTADYTESDTLRLQYQLVNLGSDVMPYMWAAHPQFACGQDAKAIFPPHIAVVFNTVHELWGWGPREALYPWPAATNAAGVEVRLDRIGPPSLQHARKFFVLPDVRAAWAGLIRYPSHAWLRLDWDPTQVPYLSLWVDEGALNPESVAALEPTTGFYDSLAVANNKQRVAMIEPGDTHKWTLTVRVGSSEQPWQEGQSNEQP
jgi:galactose mutarotase-like enzyme